jgi:hypothetical protein
MKNYEDFLRLRELLEKSTSRIAAVEHEIEEREKAQATLDAAAVRADALEKRSAPGKAAAAEENRKTTAQLRDELVAAQKKADVIKGEVDKLVGRACQDIKDEAWPGFEKAVRAVHAKAAELFELEKELMALRAAVGAKLGEVTHLPMTGLPWIRNFSVSNRVGFEYEYSPLFWFRKDCKDVGIDLSAGEANRNGSR